MGKVYDHVTWWSYGMPIGLIIYGIYLLREWRRSINPNASQVERGLNEWWNLSQGVVALGGGIVLLIILIYMDCTGYLAK